MRTTDRKNFAGQTLHRPAVFYRILVTLVILAVIITVLLAVYLSNLLYREKSEQIDQISILRLEQAAGTVETALASLEADLDSLHWNSEFVSFSVNPAATDISRDQNILQTMSSIRVSELEEEIFFVSFYSDQVFTSRGEILSLTENEDAAGLWTAFLDTDRREAEVSDLYTRDSMFLDSSGNLYVCSELMIAQPISALICQVDMEALSRMLRVSQDEPDSCICVFDRDGRPLLEDYCTYWCSEEELEDSSLFLMSGEEAQPGELYYRYVSGNNSWSYVASRDSSFRSVAGGELAAVLLPILLVVILVSLLFSWYIARTVYRPIGKLVDLFMGGDPSASDRGVKEDAFAYMEDAYRRMADENERVRGMAREFSLKILKDTMKRIIDGRLLDDEKLTETLTAIGNPVKIHDRYTVILGHMAPPEAGPSQKMEQNMYMISVYEILSSWTGGESRIQVLPIYTYFDTIAVVLTAPAEVSVLSLQREAVAVQEKILAVSGNFPYRFYWGRGRIYEHINDLRNSYADARKDLQYQLYHEGTPRNLSAGDPDWAEEKGGDPLPQLMGKLGSAGQEETGTLVTRILEEIREKAGSGEQVRELCEQLCNSLLEKMLSLHIPEEEVKNICVRPIGTMLAEAESAEEMVRVTEKLCQQSLLAMEMYSRKSKYAYVEAAEEYIRLHYRDSDLSQNEVAEHVGISPSYLSEKFREVTGQSFSSYLNSYRVEQAKLLLAAGSVAVGEVGFLCGFSSAQNFSRVFRRMTGQSPTQFRSRNQDSQEVRS